MGYTVLLAVALGAPHLLTALPLEACSHVMGMSLQLEELLERFEEMHSNNICGADRYIPSLNILPSAAQTAPKGLYSN